MPTARSTDRTSAQARTIVAAVFDELNCRGKALRVYVIGPEGEIVMRSRGSPPVPPLAARLILSRWLANVPRPAWSYAYGAIDEQHGDLRIRVQPLTSASYPCALILEER